MKKIVKTSASLFLSATLLATSLNFDGFNIAAGAEGDINTTITYAENGAAILEITPSEWENQVRYTTDGTVPTEDSTLYVSKISITEKTVVRIAEFEDGKRINGIKTTVTPKTAPVSFFVEQNYDDGTATITMDCETLGAKIYYTTDGTKPSEDSALYLGPIEVDENMKVRARAYKDDFLTKTTYVKTVKVKKNTVPEETEVEVKDPAEETTAKTSVKTETETETETEATENTSTNEKTETETEEKKIVVEKDSEESSVKEKVDYKFTYMDKLQKTYVTLLKSKTGNVIRYTTDGSAVTKDSKKYSKRVTFSEPGVFRAKEYTKSGELVATLKINVKIKCAPVEFTCIDISSGTNTIEMSTKTKGATIYYTVDGSNPDPKTSEKYTEAVTLGGQVSIKAMAIKDDYKKSSITMSYAGSVPLTLPDFDFSNPVYSELAELFNAERRKEGLKELVLDEKLTEAASVRAKEISFYYDHQRPSGKAYYSVFSEYGIKASFSSEVTTSFKETPEEVFQHVKYTKDDIARVLDNSVGYNKIGIGFYEKRGGKFWVIILIRED